MLNRRQPWKFPTTFAIGLIGLIILACLSLTRAFSQGLPEAEAPEELLRRGAYRECITTCDDLMQRQPWDDRWPVFKLRAELTIGDYRSAIITMSEALRRHQRCLELVPLARQTLRMSGNEAEAEALMNQWEQRILADPRGFLRPENFVALGQFFLARGEDARAVLDQFYDRATQERPEDLEGYFATAELALDKSDYALAAESLAQAPEIKAKAPRYHVLMARALRESDRQAASEAIARALKINPRDISALLLTIDAKIDEERYDQAEALIDRVLEINPNHQLGWAYRAVLAHLGSQFEVESQMRNLALATWSSNPEVDHLVGRKLSQKYRFAEGSAYQERALALDPNYVPAQLQLCQDRLRLGDEERGWSLAEQVHQADPYNVIAFNLLTLRDTLKTYSTLEAEGLTVRMAPEEATLYGDRVLTLLSHAKQDLEARYQVTVDRPILVEIFPQRKDFSVRTFAMPGVEGFLGVCFGPVITAISPSAQGETPTNWESVLWHEYCHVVTLTKTNNRMPRWLSEGISVYEERRANPTWGQTRQPIYPSFLTGDELTPLSQLSSAFLAPPSPVHLQFAYYESALAVEFLIDRFGFTAFVKVLDDLADGVPINEAIVLRTRASLDELDEQFSDFAGEHARVIAPRATWEQPELGAQVTAEVLRDWLERHPSSFFGHQQLASLLVSQGRWQDALTVLEAWRDLDPSYVGPENAYVSLALVHRELGQPDREGEVLRQWLTYSSDAPEARRRLIELAESEGDWEEVAAQARGLLAVNPIILAPHRALAIATQELGRWDESALAYQRWLDLDQTRLAEVQFRLATVLHAGGKRDRALREVLKALEEAPRYLEAHRLLLTLVREQEAIANDPPSPTTRIPERDPEADPR